MRSLELVPSGMRRCQVAAVLGVSEAEVVASLEPVGEARRLAPAWAEILHELPRLGTVMAVTRNPACIIEKVGTYEPPEFAGPQLGQITGPAIDLRLFLQQWRFGFAVRAAGRASLEFFGADGNAVHKVLVRDDGDLRAFERLVARFAGDSGGGDEPVIAQRSAGPATVDDDAVDAASFRRALTTMQSTHDFLGIVRTFRLTREQGLRLAGEPFASRVAARGYRGLLENAARRGVSIMAFVGNDGCLQIHTGAIARVAEIGGYFNVLDPDFNLHLRENSVARAWIVRKPTHDGTISSLELYDGGGTLIAQFFGERHRREPERANWRALLRELPAEHIA